MDTFTWLLWLCIAMFFGAYLAGLVPLAIAMHPGRLRLITIFGAGLLVGTALIVIIPEGVAMHYASKSSGAGGGHSHSRASPSGSDAHVLAGHSTHDHAGGGRLLLEVDAPLFDATRVVSADSIDSMQLREVEEEEESNAVVSGGARSLEKIASSIAEFEKHSSNAAGSRKGTGGAAKTTRVVRTQAAATAGHSDASADTLPHAHAESEEDAHGEVEVDEAEVEEDPHNHETGHWMIGAALAAGFAFQLLVDRVTGSYGHSHGGSGGSSSSVDHACDSNTASNSFDGKGSTGNHGVGGSQSQSDAGPSGKSGGIELSLSGGNSASASSSSATASNAIANSSANSAGAISPSSSSSSSPHSGPSSSSLAEAKSFSALAGLVVHAAVDGVALGASLVNGDGSLGMIVFVAIMLHKAPSALGLTSYLLSHGISAAGTQRRLFLFSCAAPAGAIVTYLLLSLRLFDYTQESLAICLLFSGGTFLYVATVHILPEIQATAGASAASVSAVTPGELLALFSFSSGGGASHALPASSSTSALASSSSSSSSSSSATTLSSSSKDDDDADEEAAATDVSNSASNAVSRRRGLGSSSFVPSSAETITTRSQHHHHDEHGKLSWLEVATLISGVLLPLLLNLNHGH